ncbi:MAG: nucleotide exchange factor GrpE [Patescibacteria group bacterium]
MSKAKKPTIEELLQQIGELTEALQRERADAINIRRQHAEQSAGLRYLIKADVIEQLLPAIDHLELSLKHVPSDIKNHQYVKGVQSVVKQFEKIFTDIGIEKVKTIGEVFDPKVHEAITAEDGAEDIIEEIQAGYKLGNYVIRPAKVHLAKK